MANMNAPMGFGGASGANIGSAHAEITFGTQQAIRAIENLTSALTNFQRNTARVSTGVANMSRNSTRELRQMASALHHLSQQFTLMSAASAAAFGLLLRAGTRASDQIREFTVMYTAITGSQQQANQLMADFRRLASQANIPIGTMLESAQTLAPALRLAGLEVRRYAEAASIAQRLAVLNPRGAGGGAEGAAIAMSEAFAGQYISLQRRFNINPDLFRQALREAGGDELRAFDIMLNHLGITIDTVAQANLTFSNTMARLGDSLGQLMAVTLGPALEQVIPMIDSLVDSINNLTQSNPQMARLIGTFTLLALTILPLTKLAIDAALAWANLRLAIITTGPMLQRSGLLSLGGMTGTTTAFGGRVPLINPAMTGAILGGGALGLLGATAWGQATPESQRGPQAIGQTGLTFQAPEATNEGNLQRFSDFITQLIALLPQAVATLGDFVLIIGAIGVAISDFIANAYSLLLNIPGLSAELRSSIEANLAQMREDNLARANELAESSANMHAWADAATTANVAAAIGYGSVEEAALAAAQANDEAAQEQLDILTEYNENRARLEEEFAQQQLRAQQDEQQRQLDAIEDFNHQRARALEQFNHQQQRQHDDLDRQIADLADESQQRTQQEQSDFYQRVTEIQTNYQDDEQDRLQSHLLSLQRMQEDHEDALREAASNLDAIAIVREMQNYNKRRRRAEEDFNNDANERRQQYQQRLDQEIRAHTERLQVAREADAQRIADMRANLAQQQALDYQEFLYQQQQDAIEFQYQQQQQAEQFRRRQALAQAAHDAELKQLYMNAQQRMAQELGLQTSYYLASTQQLDLFLRGVRNRFAELNNLPTTNYKPGQAPTGGTNTIIKPMQTGGPVDNTGLYMLHRGEEVLNPMAANMWRSILGSNLQTAMPVVSKNIQFSQTLILNGITNPDEFRVAAREAITEAFEELGQ